MEIVTLRDQFEANSNAFVKGFFTLDDCKSLTDYAFSLREKKQFSKVNSKATDNIAEYFDYGAPFNKTLLRILPTVEKITKKTLLPTYFYGLVYLPGENLRYHTDRKACEYTVSVTLATGSDYKWPFFLETNKGVVNYVTEIGDAIIFKGNEFHHWRNKFEGVWQLQVMFHYVDMHGDSREWVWLKRTFDKIDL